MFIYALFSDVLSNSDCITSNSRLSKDELFQVLSRHWCILTEKSNKKKDLWLRLRRDSKRAHPERKSGTLPLEPT